MGQEAFKGGWKNRHISLNSIQNLKKSHVDENVLYAFESILDEIKTHLSEDLKKISGWFRENLWISTLMNVTISV